MKVDMRDAFFEQLVKAAYQDERIVFLTADHGAFALRKFEEEMPDRYFNLGIAEQNMMGVAAGLAASGKIVFAYGIAPFVSLRVLEQLTIDIAAMRLPVNVVSVGAGFTYSTDGPTHHGLQDMSAVLTIPHITVLNSSDPENTRHFVDLVLEEPGPHYIRIEKEKVASLPRANPEINWRKMGFSILRESQEKSVLILSTGIVTHEVMKCLDDLEKVSDVSVTVADIFQVKPFPDGLLSVIAEFDQVISIEEGYSSGFASQLLVKLSESKGAFSRLSIVALDDRFYFDYDDRPVLRARLQLKEKLIEILEKVAGRNICNPKRRG